MSLNCNEINLILEELDLTGAFIQEIVQPGYDMLALYTYKEGTAKTVVVCTAQNSIRMNETRRKITKNEKPLRFMEFLRSHIKGCRINSCEQVGFERIVKLELSRMVPAEEKKANQQTVHVSLVKKPVLSKEELAAQNEPEEIEENYILYIKLWNNAANVILCDTENTILEPMFRRPERGEVKGEKFEVEVKQIDEAAALEKYPVREWNGVLGAEPYEHSSPGDSLKTVHRTVFTLQGRAAPYLGEGVAENAEGGWSEGKAFPSFNSFIDWHYSEQTSALSRTALLEKAEKWYNQRHSKMETALNNLLQKKERFENAEQIKHQGDLILTYGHLITPDSKFLECEDYETGRTLRIMIDPKKTAQENAQEYYKNYKKAVSGAVEIEHDIKMAQSQLEKLDEQYAQICAEQNPVKIEQLLRRDTTPTQQKKKNHPGLDYTINGWYILVGRDANENDELLRHHVRGDDLWLHVRDFPGGYVFIKARKGKTVPLEILLDAANLAVHYSTARSDRKSVV